VNFHSFSGEMNPQEGGELIFRRFRVSLTPQSVRSPEQLANLLDFVTFVDQYGSFLVMTFLNFHDEVYLCLMVSL
jgi:hypothetical protein